MEQTPTPQPTPSLNNQSSGRLSSHDQSTDLDLFLSNLNQSFAIKPQENYTKLGDLPIQLKSVIKDIVKITTKYGGKLVITLCTSQLGKTVEYKSFLPDRFLKLTEFQI